MKLSENERGNLTRHYESQGHDDKTGAAVRTSLALNRTEVYYKFVYRYILKQAVRSAEQYVCFAE